MLLVIFIAGSLCFRGYADMIAAYTENQTAAEGAEATESEAAESEEMESEETETVLEETEEVRQEIDIGLSIEGDSPRNNGYYRSNVALAGLITGDSLNGVDGYWTIAYTKAGADERYEGTYSHEELAGHLDAFGLVSVSMNGQDSEMMNTKGWKMVFKGEGIYRVTFTAAGNDGYKITSKTIEFVIDRTVPEAEIMYRSKNGGRQGILTESSLQNPVYMNGEDGGVYILIAVSELNFTEKESPNMGKVDADLALSVETADRGQQNEADRVALELGRGIRGTTGWQQGDGNTMVYGIPIETDGSYRFDFTYTDLAGNQLEKHVTGCILLDTRRPVIQFKFDTSDGKNGSYYKQAKTLTIEVREQNFDMACEPEVITDQMDGCSFSGWELRGAMTVGTVTFYGDGEYHVVFECCDLAGNKSQRVESDTFVIDQTQPVIQVDYDDQQALNGIYYQNLRTAVITIKEQNFRPEDVKISAVSEDGEN